MVTPPMSSVCFFVYSLCPVGGLGPLATREDLRGFTLRVRVSGPHFDPQVGMGAFLRELPLQAHFVGAKMEAE
jgi:hypothetical protein